MMKRIDGELGTRTWGGRMLGTDTELGMVAPLKSLFLINFTINLLDY